MVIVKVAWVIGSYVFFSSSSFLLFKGLDVLSQGKGVNIDIIVYKD